MDTLVIAEPGATHEGRLDLMYRLIDVAAEAGCDVFKNQWTSSAEQMVARRHAPAYLADYRKIQYPIAWHVELQAYAETKGLQYGCSVYVPGEPTFIAPLVDYLKISSFEANDWDLVEEAQRAGRRSSAGVIVSLGMRALWPQPRRDEVLLLHCVSAYPAPLASLGLEVLRGGVVDGFSDHSRDVRVGGWAVCAGAIVLETHFRLDDCDPANKDYAVAFTPAELKDYVANVRDAELVMDTSRGAIQRAEQAMLKHRVTA